jgi:hypothetical protein
LRPKPRNRRGDFKALRQAKRIVACVLVGEVGLNFNTVLDEAS